MAIIKDYFNLHCNERIVPLNITGKSGTAFPEQTEIARCAFMILRPSDPVSHHQQEFQEWGSSCLFWERLCVVWLPCLVSPACVPSVNPAHMPPKLIILTQIKPDSFCGVWTAGFGLETLYCNILVCLFVLLCFAFFPPFPLEFLLWYVVSWCLVHQARMVPEKWNDSFFLGACF